MFYTISCSLKSALAFCIAALVASCVSLTTPQPTPTTMSQLTPTQTSPDQIASPTARGNRHIATLLPIVRLWERLTHQMRDTLGPRYRNLLFKAWSRKGLYRLMRLRSFSRMPFGGV